MIIGSGTLSVSTFFELRRAGDQALFSRVGIASSRPDMTTFLIPRVREKQAPGSGRSDIETGFAIVNTGSVQATVTAKLMDVNGNVVATTVLVLKPNTHIAGIVNSAFNLSGESTGRQYQYILFSSDQSSIGAAALS
jgi:hypothetical protein